MTEIRGTMIPNEDRRDIQMKEGKDLHRKETKPDDDSKRI